MIKRGSPEWIALLDRLEQIKLKSNREVLCVKCWQMLNCKQKIKHLKAFPNHNAFLLTSSRYASEEKICELAYGYNRMVKKTDGNDYMLSPFAPTNLRMMDELKKHYDFQN